MASRVIPVDPFDLVIFGGTGDLARRKILPGLFRRFCQGQMTPESQIIGAARAEMDDAGFRQLVADAITEFGPKDANPKDIAAFLTRLGYVAIDAKGNGGWADLKSRMRDGYVRAFYFSVAPALFGDLAQRLHTNDIAQTDSRIVVEKPFGKDLQTARALNAMYVSEGF